MNIHLAGLAIVTLCIFLACQPEEQIDQGDSIEPKDLPEALPFTHLALDDLTAFEAVAKNWGIAGSAFADLNQDRHLTTGDGMGILTNLPTESAKDNLRTKWEHGDLELHVDVMMPKGSNSGIYFQGRYEVQLFDSWDKKDPAHSDMGGIYQQWDEQRTGGNKGFNGIAPTINAAKAPGLWQHFHILFRAPRFDKKGQKVKNARFEYVYLNDVLIHENVQVEGPTRAHQLSGEVQLGPLFFQGDHGPVAFRNLRYKKYGLDTARLENITYRSYTGIWNHLPDFDTLVPVKDGSLPNLDLALASDQPNDFGVRFRADLWIPIKGKYLFDIKVDDWAVLMIDTLKIAIDDGEILKERGTIDLTEGLHILEIMFHQKKGRSMLDLSYEGPEISKRPLAKPASRQGQPKNDVPPILVGVGETPEMVRGFVMHGDEKLTHTISIGTPKGIHFSYDLSTGALISAWKGAFADATNMWRGRGASQLLIPLSAAIQLTNGVPLARIEEKDPWPTDASYLSYKGYVLEDDQMPVFTYQVYDLAMTDRIVPTDHGHLKRQIELIGGSITNETLRIGVAPSIVFLDNGLYSMDGQYYIDTKSDAKILHRDGYDELLLSFGEGGKSDLSYDIIW